MVRTGTTTARLISWPTVRSHHCSAAGDAAFAAVLELAKEERHINQLVGLRPSTGVLFRSLSLMREAAATVVADSPSAEAFDCSSRNLGSAEHGSPRKLVLLNKLAYTGTRQRSPGSMF